MSQNAQQILQEYLSRAHPKHADLKNLIAHIRNQAKNPGGIAAILLYGSGLWKEATPETVWDLYVLTDKLSDYDSNLGIRIAGHIMPPNVYYASEPMPCKYGIMRLDQFARGCSQKSWKPQIWARFAQPCAIVYVRDEAVKSRVTAAISHAVLSFHTQALPFAKNIQDPESIWIAGLMQTYASELRSEDQTRARELFEAQKEEFSMRTRLALPCIDIDPQTFPARRMKTQVMRPFLKFLYFLQLIKASLIFENGVDYALWKIKRHSGLEFTATALQKKYPLIFGWPLLWKIYKAGALH